MISREALSPVIDSRIRRARHVLIVVLLALSFGLKAQELGFHDVLISNNSSELKFISDSLDLQKELTRPRPTFPAEDVQFTIFLDEDGFQAALYKLTGKSLEYVQMGSFVGKQRLQGSQSLMSDDDNDDNEGKTCKTKWSCGRAVFACLENGDDALVSEGACSLSASSWCVTCQ